jgi:predicted 2-oxoglutarate/Fe(II)-dependent dioxygenase YbiX
MHLTRHSGLIWTIDNFLSAPACAQLIATSENIGYKEAEVNLSSGAQMMKGLRNNYRALHSDQALADDLWEKLRGFCPEQIDGTYAVGLNEQFRFYKYESAQRFKRHLDGRFRRNEQEESRITFMIYLNDDFEGGETAFDHVTIQPATGTALCFIHEQKHEGCPVTRGIKYALRSDVIYRSAK